MDAGTENLTGETAFRRILGWKAGNFEMLPPEPARTRTIFSSYQGLLLETAQALDEAQARSAPGTPSADLPPESAESKSVPPEVAQFKGVEFIVMTSAREKEKHKVWGVENPEQMAEWARQTAHRFRSLGENLEAGQLNRMEGLSPQRQLVLASHGEKDLCVAFHRTLSRELIHQNMKNIFDTWAS